MESRSRKRNTPRSQQSVICEAPEPEAAISSVETRARSLSIEPMVLVAEAVLPGGDAARTRQREGSCARQPREEAQAVCARNGNLHFALARAPKTAVDFFQSILREAHFS